MRNRLHIRVILTWGSRLLLNLEGNVLRFEAVTHQICSCLLVFLQLGQDHLHHRQRLPTCLRRVDSLSSSWFWGTLRSLSGYQCQVRAPRLALSLHQDLCPNFSLWFANPKCRRSQSCLYRTFQICTWNSRSLPSSTSKRCQFLHSLELLDFAHSGQLPGHSVLWCRHLWALLRLQ